MACVAAMDGADSIADTTADANSIKCTDGPRPHGLARDFWITCM